jgi:hypothetical protein
MSTPWEGKDNKEYSSKNNHYNNKNKGTGPDKERE